MRSREKATSQRMSRSFQDEEGGKTFQKHGDNKPKIENGILLYFLYLYNKGNRFKFKEEVLSLPETEMLSLDVFPLEKMF